MEAANALEEKLRKADREAEELRKAQQEVEEEKAMLAAAAADQKKQSEADVSVPILLPILPSLPPFLLSLLTTHETRDMISTAKPISELM